MKKFILLFCAFGLIACGGGGGGSSGGSTPPPPPPPTNNFPTGYQCFPSGLGSLNSTNNNLKIAYAQNCSASSASASTNLPNMAIAMETYIDSTILKVPSSGYYNYCTGTPIQYNPVTGVGFIVTAAHCVIGGSKSANSQITANNIITFNLTNGSRNTGNRAWIYQGLGVNSTTPLAQSNMIAQVVAIYVPSQYCQIPSFNTNGTCSNLVEQNGDVAILKIKVLNTKILGISNNLQLAPSNFAITSKSYLLALGYGGVNQPTPNPLNGYLNYINYQYFGTDSYAGNTGEDVIMNGYLSNGGYYSIICGGDSGGGDFAWDGINWNLIGIHSYGSALCGAASSSYLFANDESTDVRPWTNWIQNILNSDTQSTGCSPTLTATGQYVCSAGSAQ